VQAPEPLVEIIADKGYHSNQIMIDLAAVGLRSYVAEPDRGRRDWSEEPAAQTLVMPIGGGFVARAAGA
jgi:transposase